MILNAFDSENIHRVQLHDQPDRICHTYITDTNDLFIMAQKGQEYLLQMIDLDAGNIREQDKDQRKAQNSYRIQKLLKYNQERVNSQPLL